MVRGVGMVCWNSFNIKQTKFIEALRIEALREEDDQC